ncbi:MAG: ribosome small subunit-dependent GTPase A [Clostridiales bacterium]|jgi:ribosome biogenesis GTPase|nr:ribosome small subunit-dependent GTPase A [Clostridiales bacterium]
MADILTGRIIKGVGGNYNVATNDGEFVCQARGLFRKKGISPIVGDFVKVLVIDRAKATGYLKEILPRTNELARPKVANIDQVVLVCTIVAPPINLDVVDGFLIVCENQGIDAVLCINKIDLDADKLYLEVAKSFEMAKYQVICTSAARGLGLEVLRDVMAGKTSILAGPSGVGKSSILNALYPQLQLEVGTLSEKIQRGKHTTRHTSLLEVSKDTFLVDSPGFTSFSISHIDKKHLQNCYPEFKPYLEECYYIDCIHVSEHDCAVKERVGLDIDIGRYERYKRYVSGRNDQ